MFYPKQTMDAVPTPYPWTVQMSGENSAVIDCELLNPYMAINATEAPRHLIRNVMGYVPRSIVPVALRMLVCFRSCRSCCHCGALRLHAVRQPLYMGIYIDQTYDIGRVENVHWNVRCDVTRSRVCIHCRAAMVLSTR